MSPTRRTFLALAATLVAGCSASPAARPGATSGKNSGVTPRKITYGSDPAQFGELSLPGTASPHGTVVIVHGGFWQAQYDLSLGRPLAADLVEHGYAVWNLEYRRVGNGGGWPQTFDDVAAGVDRLADLDVETSRVVAVGHSAGGQLAVWAAGRGAAGSRFGPAKVALTGVVSQAGVLDMATAAATGVGGTAEADLLGGNPEQVPERYRLADPIAGVPLTAPVYCLHSRADANVPFAQSTAYVAAAKAAGAAASLHETQGDHFTLIDPSSAAWAAARDALPDLLAARLPAA